MSAGTAGAYKGGNKKAPADMRRKEEKSEIPQGLISVILTSAARSVEVCDLIPPSDYV